MPEREWHSSCLIKVQVGNMRTFLPSRLDFTKSDRSIQLQFTGLGYDLCLFERGHAVTRSMLVSAAQLRQVSIDMRPIQLGPLKFVFENRHVVVERNDHV